MDYDRTNLAATYDAGRSYTPEAIAFWLDTIASITRRDRFDDILDLGCGTGRYSAPLAARFGARVVALDPSLQMLTEARRKGGDRVRFVRGSGDALPLPAASVDLVFMSMVFHHFETPDQVVEECRRVLRTGGLVCLRACTKEQIDEFPYVRFFPASRTLLAGQLQAADAIERSFSRRGFSLTEHRIVHATLADSWPIYSEKIATRTYSDLAQLSSGEFQSGLTALLDYVRTSAPPGPVDEPIDLFAFHRD